MVAEVRLIPCLKDNYAVLLHDPSGATALVDAPDAGPRCPCGGTRRRVARRLSPAVAGAFAAWARNDPVPPGDPVRLYLGERRRAPTVVHHLAAMAAIGAFVVVEMWRFMDVDFEVTFYGHASYNGFLVKHVGLGQLVIALLAVFGSILYVLVHEGLDQKSQQEESQVRAILEARSLLDAEIGPSEGQEAGLPKPEILPPKAQAKHPRDGPRSRD